MRTNLVVAASANNVIGASGELPWHLPDDFRYFKQLTMGKPIVMGRRTWDSIGRALPGRRNIVMTRAQGFAANGATVVASLEDALRAAADDDELMVIGGGQIYRAFWPLADRIYLTRVAATIPGDTFFPELEQQTWQLTSTTAHPKDERHEHAFTFDVYDRR